MALPGSLLAQDYVVNNDTWWYDNDGDVVHGELDKAVPFANAKETADLMKQINPQFTFTSFPDLGHSKGGTLRKRDLYDWLLAHTRAE